MVYLELIFISHISVQYIYIYVTGNMDNPDIFQNA
jgi:hypothetical protein